MDNRVILNLPPSLELSKIPELAGIHENIPTLTACAPVLHTRSCSLIIPTFFNAALKQESLQLVLSGIEQSECITEIILVSSDGEKNNFEKLRGLLGGRRLVVVEAPPHNRAASRNLGAAAASSPYLVFLDDDMLPKSWRIIDVVLSRLVTTGSECALFPRRHYARFPVLFDRWCLESVVKDWRLGLNAENPFFFDPIAYGTKDLPLLFCFPGCFMVIQKDVYERLNGFDERFVGWGFEDTDFALRAMRWTRVLNLFRACEPFLHIDHPVSPYKSEEHEGNALRYYAAGHAVDIHRFARTIFIGADFSPEAPSLLGEEIHLQPFRELAQAGIPLHLGEMQPWASFVAGKLMSGCRPPYPEFVVLHGSRTQRKAARNSDYDLLCLYDSSIQEFFATGGTPRVEIECANMFFFSSIAEQPWRYDHRGMLELAKIARTKLLSGDPKRWTAWRDPLLREAGKNGRIFWLVLAVGIRLNLRKYGYLAERYFGSLVKVFEAFGETPEFDVGIDGKPLELASYVATELDRFNPAWRTEVASRTKIFPLQVPDVWIALDYIAAVRSSPLPHGIDYAQSH